jgi:hypothetical protein
MLKKIKKLPFILLVKFNQGFLALLALIPKFKYGQFFGLEYRAKFALNRGNLYQTENLANKLLIVAENYKEDWNYSNAIHKAHLIIGQVYLIQGDIDKAEKELLAASDIDGSPQLNSFGPNMSLANDLLKHNRDEIVLSYLENCRSFWSIGDEYINYWSYQIKKGETPDFGGNLHY